MHQMLLMAGMAECLALLYTIRTSQKGTDFKTSAKISLDLYHFIDIVEEHGHAFPLSPGLIPIVYFQNVEKVFLGKPFTTCIETSAINSYAKWVSSAYGSYHIV